MIISDTVLWLRAGRMVSSDLATYKSPLAIVTFAVISTVFVNHIALLLRKSNPLVNWCFPLLTFFCYHTLLCPSLY